MLNENQIILVDEQDNELGSAEKYAVHQHGWCHRAFSIFVFSSNSEGRKMLIQRRHPDKYHSGGLLSNSCCSHPKVGENLLEAAHRRLKEELSLDITLKAVGSFHYCAKFANGLIENEYDHVLIGFTDQTDIIFNTEEISEVFWIDIPTVLQDLTAFPQKYTVWFTPALNISLTAIKDKLC